MSSEHARGGTQQARIVWDSKTRCRMTSAQKEELVDIDRLRCTCLSVWLLQNEGVLIGQ